MLRRVPGCHALVAGPGTPVTAAVLAAGAELKVVGRAGVDVGEIDVAEATRRGIVVVHAPDSALISEAEHALALVLACARDLAGADAALRAGDAARSDRATASRCAARRSDRRRAPELERCSSSALARSA